MAYTGYIGQAGGSSAGASTGEWNSNTYPYNLSTFTASSNVHPDLPSEPPGYDEFEFSFPSDMSPSLFGLPFINENGERGILSPESATFPPLSSKGNSPRAWPDANLAHSQQHASTSQGNDVARALVSGSHTADAERHTRRDSASAPQKLFGADEQFALDEFFHKTLEEKPVADPTATQGESGPTQNVSLAHPIATGTGSTALSSSSNPRASTRKATGKRGTQNISAPKAKQSTKRNTAALQEEPVAVPDIAGPQVTNSPVQSPDEPSIPAKRMRSNSTQPDAVESTGLAASGSGSGATGKRSSHIASEQKRRSSIKDNYKALVDLLLAGEPTSGISLLNGALEETEVGKNGKPKGRGRGRKGQDGAGATKSVVLERAADYLKWLEGGNAELDKEIARLEGVLAK